MNRILITLKATVKDQAVRYVELMADVDPAGMAMYPLDPIDCRVDPLTAAGLLRTFDAAPARRQPAVTAA